MRPLETRRRGVVRDGKLCRGLGVGVVPGHLVLLLPSVARCGVKLLHASAARRPSLAERWSSANAAKTLLVDAMRAAMVMPGFYDRAEEEMVAALAGGDPRDGQTAGIDRLNRLLVARFIAAREANSSTETPGGTPTESTWCCRRWTAW
ncbi:hypothetical protein ACLQ3B_04830 [Micromonospora sp. DT53]|uniref:hypothetical protein n=1 Tax=Micromonospora sp. DT53 TaxID=3393444 RepID=UPI003CF4AD4B